MDFRDSFWIVNQSSRLITKMILSEIYLISDIKSVSVSLNITCAVLFFLFCDFCFAVFCCFSFFYYLFFYFILFLLRFTQSQDIMGNMKDLSFLKQEKIQKLFKDSLSRFFLGGREVNRRKFLRELSTEVHFPVKSFNSKNNM